MTSESTSSVTALVPMRGDSERVPAKNLRSFAGAPLFEHILRTLTQCPEVARIVVDTDGPDLKAAVTKTFPDVVVIDRPSHLRGGHVPVNEILYHDVKSIEGELFLQTHCTNPLLTSETISRCVHELLAKVPIYDSLFTVTRLQDRIWDSVARPINHNPNILLRTQDLPLMFIENSCVYLFPREVMETRRNRIGGRPLMLEMDPVEGWDIDEETDFVVGELLYHKAHGAS